jgi:hypothetical protein
MANRLNAINAYCPRIVKGKTVQSQQLVGYIADRTGLNRGDVRHMLDEFQDALVFFANNGQGVKLEGVATFGPKIDLKGKISLSSRIAIEINSRLNMDGAFNGDIENSENIGKTTDELVAMWNEAHPDDPVE